MTWPLTATAAALVPSGSTARRDRTTRSYFIGLPPAEARRAVRRVPSVFTAAVSHAAYRASRRSFVASGRRGRLARGRTCTGAGRRAIINLPLQALIAIIRGAV